MSYVGAARIGGSSHSKKAYEGICLGSAQEGIRSNNENIMNNSNIVSYCTSDLSDYYDSILYTITVVCKCQHCAILQ